ncbi:MAG: hypothetical protein ACW96X_11685 [Promethearchaeota archaeon]
MSAGKIRKIKEYNYRLKKPNIKKSVNKKPDSHKQFFTIFALNTFSINEES